MLGVDMRSSAVFVLRLKSAAVGTSNNESQRALPASILSADWLGLWSDFLPQTFRPAKKKR